MALEINRWATVVSIALLMTVVATGISGASGAAETGAQGDTSRSIALPVTNRGTWQVVQLALNWRRKYLQQPVPRALAVALLSPSGSEIGEDNEPCGPPQSVILVATDDAGRSRIKTLFKEEFCRQSWHPPEGLAWAKGPRVAIESIGVSILTDGSLEVAYTATREEGHSDDPSTNTPQRGTWKQILTVPQVQAVISAR